MKAASHIPPLPPTSGASPRPLVADLVRDYVSRRPALTKALRAGVIHYTGLGRRIAAHYDINQIDACKIACRRLALDLMDEEPSRIALPQVGVVDENAIQTGLQLITFRREGVTPIEQAELVAALQDRKCAWVAATNDEFSLLVAAELANALLSRPRQRPLRIQSGLAFVRPARRVDGGPANISGDQFFDSLAERGVAVLAGSAGLSEISAIFSEEYVDQIRVDEHSATAISSATNQYINSHRSIKDALALGLVNYAALARQLAEESGAKSVAAVASSLRRFATNRNREVSADEDSLRVLRNSICTVQTEVAANYFNSTELQKGFDYIANVSSQGVSPRFTATAEGISVFAHTLNLGRPEVILSKKLPYHRRLSSLEIASSELTSQQVGLLDHLLFLLRARNVLPLEYSIVGSSVILFFHADQIGLAIHEFLSMTRE